MAAPCRGRGQLLIAALEPDDVVIGGGNVKKLKKLPKGFPRGGRTPMRSRAAFACGKIRVDQSSIRTTPRSAITTDK